MAKTDPPSLQRGLSVLFFRATIVQGMKDYWLNVTSPRLRYDINCVISAASATITSMMLFSQLLLVLAILVLIEI